MPDVPDAPPLPRAAVIREVGPRDGLQSEEPIAPERRADLAEALVAAGCRRIEAASFVSEKAVPAMAGGAAVVERLASLPNRSDLTVAVLVPNLRGAESALATEIDEITVTVAASAEYNEKNVHRTIGESVAEIARVAKTRGRIPLDAVVSCAFGSPYEGDIPANDILDLVDQLLDADVDTITLADTTGMATPRVLAEVVTPVAEALAAARPDAALGLHLHDSRGTALLNAYAALQLGIIRFDTAVGGLGGSPFARGAGGNLGTEDFVALLDDLGVDTGIDLATLLAASRLVHDLVGHPLPSKVATAGARLSQSP